MSWNLVVALGIAVSVASILLGRGARSASDASLERRCRWAIRLGLGYAAVLAVSVLVPLVRFAWATWFDAGATYEQRALLLQSAIGAGLNLVLGFLFFGMAPTLVAFMVARRMKVNTEG